MNQQVTKWAAPVLLLLIFTPTGCGPVTAPPPPASPAIGDRHTITIGAASYHLRYLSGKILLTGYKDDGNATVNNKYWIAETEVTCEE